MWSINMNLLCELSTTFHWDEVSTMCLKITLHAYITITSTRSTQPKGYRILAREVPQEVRKVQRALWTDQVPGQQHEQEIQTWTNAPDRLQLQNGRIPGTQELPSSHPLKIEIDEERRLIFCRFRRTDLRLSGWEQLKDVLPQSRW